jgi:predicted GH43/DUF377 family glycosyl hydrolase
VSRIARWLAVIVIASQLPDGGPRIGFRRLGVVIVPDGSALEVEGVLNPGATRDLHGDLLLYPRMVVAGNESRIGLVRAAKNGDWERLGSVLEPDRPYERRQMPGGQGCEDPRVTFIADIGHYVMTYTAFGPNGARIALVISRDAYSWTRLGLMNFHAEHLNTVDNKDAAFFPEVVWSPSEVPSFAFFHRPMRPESIGWAFPKMIAGRASDRANSEWHGRPRKWSGRAPLIVLPTLRAVGFRPAGARCGGAGWPCSRVQGAGPRTTFGVA